MISGVGFIVLQWPWVWPWPLNHLPHDNVTWKVESKKKEVDWQSRQYPPKSPQNKTTFIFICQWLFLSLYILLSGWSRISQTGAPTPKGVAKLLFGQFLSKNCTKMKNFWTRGGHPCTPLGSSTTGSFEHFTACLSHTTIFTELNALHEVYTHLIIDFKQNEDEGKLRNAVN